ncbi:MAG: hypothetical protein GTO23_08625 [Nitrososphaeria archaeon]|nr:hypothetical protein [Nitrososphaeria archaeon]
MRYEGKFLFAISLIGFLLSMRAATDDLRVIYASPYENIDVDTAFDMITNGTFPDLVVLDVRTKSKYDSGHNYAAVWIPVAELEERIGELAGHENDEIIVYCASGGRSVTASGILDSYNFTKVYNMLGGISAWQNAGYPVWIATVHNVNTTFNYDTIQAAIDAPKTLDGHTIFVEEGTYYENVVVDKSLTLAGENKSSTTVDGDNYGNVFHLFQVENVSISSFTIRNCGSTVVDNGILVSYSSNVTIFNNIITENNWNGIQLISSNNNNISHNSITDNYHRGIDLTASSYNTLSKNNLTNNADGIVVKFLCNNNTVSGNNASNNVDIGIAISFGNNTLLDNIVSSNGGFGVGLHGPGNLLRNNLMMNNTYSLWLYFEDLEDAFNDVDISNLVDGRPVYYWIDKHDDEVPPDAGYVALLNCSNIVVDNLSLEKNGQGILLANTNNSLITCNRLSENRHGIHLALSHNKTVSNNMIENSEDYGILLYLESSGNTIITNTISNNGIGINPNRSGNNTIFHNNFENNIQQVYSYASTNAWNNGFEGNYWSHYSDADSDYDGIGDSPRIIDGDNRDTHPLMGIFSSFNTSMEKAVDVISNSTIEDLEYFQEKNTIKIFVSNMTSDQTSGFCRVAIPHALMNVTNIEVIIDSGTTPLLYHNYRLHDNGTHRWIYFAYPHSTRKIIIVPESLSILVLPIFITSTLVASLLCKKKVHNKGKGGNFLQLFTIILISLAYLSQRNEDH